MLHENIRLKRKERGFSQEDLAVRLHVVRQTVSKWENGTSVPSAEQLVALADILDTSVSELLGATPEAGENRDRLAEELARINAQLAVRNHRTRRVLEILAAVLIAIAVLAVVGALLFMTINYMPASQLNSKIHYAMGSTKEQFLLDFALPLDEAELAVEEVFNHYEGFPYEGIALYTLAIGEADHRLFENWERLPFSDDAENFLESISAYAVLPRIEDGCWKMIDRNPRASAYTNVSFSLYDQEARIAYYLKMDI